MTVRVLWGSPLPPTRSGVADHAVELLPELARRAAVRVLLPPGREGELPAALAGLPTVAADERQADGEVQLLHLGNNPHHEWLLARLGRPRTVVVAHDLVLHHLLVEATLARGDRDGYERLLEAAHGRAGAVLARGRRYGFSARRDPFLFPARRPFLDRAAGVVVHSRWAAEQVSRELPGLPVARLGLAVSDPGPVDRAAARAFLGIPGRETVLMHLGFLTAEKGVREILTAFAAVAGAGAEVRLVLVGESRVGDELAGAVAAVGVGARVQATGWVAPEQLPRLPAAADLGVVLRSPSAGETSAAAVRFLACGTPVAVGGSPQLEEWPLEAAPRLTPGPAAAADLARILLQAAGARAGPVWERRQLAARRAYLDRHRPADAAAALVDFLERLPA